MDVVQKFCIKLCFGKEPAIPAVNSIIILLAGHDSACKANPGKKGAFPINSNSRSFQLTLIALLAGCNAALELTLGNYLNYIRFPLTGSIMVGLNLVIYTLGFRMVPRRGTVATMGFITTAMNFFFGGSFKVWSLIAIFIEALLIEAIFSLWGAGFWQVMGAGLFSNFFTMIYSFFTLSIILGRGLTGSFMAVARRVLGSGRAMGNSLVILGVALLLVHLVNGAIFGWLAWKASSMTVEINRRRNGFIPVE